MRTLDVGLSTLLLVFLILFRRALSRRRAAVVLRVTEQPTTDGVERTLRRVEPVEELGLGRPVSLAPCVVDILAITAVLAFVAVGLLALVGATTPYELALMRANRIVWQEHTVFCFELALPLEIVVLLVRETRTLWGRKAVLHA